MKIKYGWLTRDILERDYAELGSFKLIAEKHNVPCTTIKHYFKIFEIKTTPKIRYTCNDNFFSEDTEGSFYAAGFIAADGCINQHKCKQPNYVSISLSQKDEDQLVMMRDLLSFTGPMKRITRRLSEINDNWNDAEQVKIDIYSKIMIRDLQRFGIGQRKSLSYVMPDWLPNHKYVSHFIRGYNDGDGSFYVTEEPWYAKKAGVYKMAKKYHCSIRGTENFLEQAKMIINQNIDVPSKSTPKLNNGIYQLHFSGKPLVTGIAQFLYDDATICMARKRKVVEGLL